jgi:hypothetical protein
VHDYFDILGVSDGAPPREIRRACARRVRHAHPDFALPGTSAAIALEGDAWLDSSFDRARRGHELAIDFVEMGPLVSRMRIAFFEDLR